MRVLELMKTHVTTVRPDVTLRDAVDLMDLYQVSGLPVVDADERLIGVVTEHDVIGALLKSYADTAGEAGHAEFAALVEGARARTVGEAMSSPAVAVDEDADVLDAARLMASHRIRRLPVTGDGRLVGVISRVDICQAILEGELAPAAQP